MKAHRNITILTFVIVLLYSFLNIIYSKSKITKVLLVRQPKSKLKVAVNKRQAEINTTTTILIWFKHHGIPHENFNPGFHVNNDCPQCSFTTDKDTITKADAIVLDYSTECSGNGNDQKTPHGEERLPLEFLENRQKISKHQYLIGWQRESAAKFSKAYLKRIVKCEENEKENSSCREKILDKSFNLTMSYRRDSDIHLNNFGSVETMLEYINKQREQNKENDEKDDRKYMDRILNDKKKVALWVVSNCNHTNEAKNRLDYAKNLQSLGLKLTGLGACFNQPLDKNNNGWNNDEKYKTQYKFYLDFENGKHCKDYLSEKFWTNSLLYERVPIVSGPHPDDVKALAPKNSYIHVEDFKSPQKLLNYINYLDKNDTAYMEYHNWRLEKPNKNIKTYTSRESRKWCAACEAVHERKLRNFPESTVASISRWWWGTMVDDECLGGELDFLK